MSITCSLRLVIPLLAFFFISISADEISVVSHPWKLQLSIGQPVEGSPGSRPGSVMTCNRVHIHGVSRLHHPSKYAHALKVRLSVAQGDALFRLQTIELCFHRNASLGVGMCPPDQWQKLSENLWVQSMSPYGYNILDIRMLPDPSREIKISTKEGIVLPFSDGHILMQSHVGYIYVFAEFLFHRLVFLVLGIIMMVMSRSICKSVVFYYGAAMTLGIMTVILIVLFQGMRLLPMGRKSSLAIFMCSLVVGLGAFVLQYVSGFLRTMLVEIGIGEDMHNPLGMLVLVCIVLAGAWFGYWGVRKLVLTEDGSVDSGVAYFVEWAIYILSVVMILQSSLDTLFAAEVLGFSIIISAITRTLGKALRRLFRRTIKSINRTSVRTSPSKRSHAECSQFLFSVSGSTRPRGGNLSLVSCNAHVSGLAKRQPRMLCEEENYYSTFHKTPGRKKFSKEEWDMITKEHTNKALKELISSLGFNQWALANVERIIVTPPQSMQT